MCGCSRLTRYRLPWTGKASSGLCAALTLIIPDVARGKLKFRRTSPRSRDPNQWQCDVNLRPCSGVRRSPPAGQALADGDDAVAGRSH
jgi:hypothetical protein